MLSEITPVVLTFNEAVNIGRALDSLVWAREVLLVDSGSTDETRQIAERYPNVRCVTRRFDDYKGQWTFGLRESGLKTPFALALDADMTASPELIDELRSLDPSSLAGGIVPFAYAFYGTELLGSLLAPQLRLLRVEKVRIENSGHGHAFFADGPVKHLKGKLIHDDRKPVEAWVSSQLRYSKIELGRLRDKRLLSVLRRRMPLTPLLVCAYAYMRAGGPLRGAAARRYAWERGIFECLLRLRYENEILEEAAR